MMTLMVVLFVVIILLLLGILFSGLAHHNETMNGVADLHRITRETNYYVTGYRADEGG